MDPLKIFIFLMICAAIVTCGCTGDQGVSRKNTPIVTPQHTYVSPPSHISDTFLLSFEHDDNCVKIMNSGTSDKPSPVNQSVSIVSVSYLPKNGTIRISGLTHLPVGSGVMYEIWPANISTRKKTVEDVEGISGQTDSSGKEGSTFWSVDMNLTLWRPGKYIVNAWPEESDPRYGDRKMFFIRLNDTVSNGLGKDSGTGEIILYAITPSEPSSLPVSITQSQRPVPDDSPGIVSSDLTTIIMGVYTGVF